MRNDRIRNEMFWRATMVKPITTYVTRMMLHTCRPTSTAQNAIVVTADLRYFCNIVQLLHAPCAYSTHHSSQMLSEYLEMSVLCAGATLSSSGMSIVIRIFFLRKFHATRLFNYLIWWVMVKGLPVWLGFGCLGLC